MSTSPVVYSYFKRPPRRSVKFDRPTMTEQDHHEETDIGEMIARMARGIQPAMNTNPPIYGDFTDFGDYRDMIERKREADEAFLTIPHDVRSKFDNNPAKLYEFLANPANVDEAKKLGFFGGSDVPLEKESPPPKEEGQAV